MRAIYAFSGDPITFGHIDIVERAAKTYEHLVVAIGQNPNKAGRYLFSVEERLSMISQCFKHLNNVKVEKFQGLLAEYAYRHRFDVIVRGVRNNTDLESELILFSVNKSLQKNIDTVFFPTNPEMGHISSSVVKAIVTEGGDVSKYCPLLVKENLERKILGKYYVGIAGGIAAGKTHFSKEILNAIQAKTDATYISLDAVGHHVLSNSSREIYKATRQKVIDTFGPDLENEDGSINRRKLGAIVFNEKRHLETLNQLMRSPMLARLYEENLDTPGGIILLEGAILIESEWTDLINNNVIIVDAPEEIRMQRLMTRTKCNEEQALQKIRRQISSKKRLSIMKNIIKTKKHGQIWDINNDGSSVNYDALSDQIIEASKL